VTDEEVLAAADSLLAALIRVLATAPPWVLEEADWDYDDEDWVRDGVHAGEAYSAWRATGEDRYVYRAPGYEAGRLKADRMASALAYLVSFEREPRDDHIRGWRVPDDVRAEADLALTDYRARRSQESDDFPLPGERRLPSR